MRGPDTSFDHDSKVSIVEGLSNKDESEDDSKESVDHHIFSKLFRVCWWNGGGAIRTRININPGLISLLETKPDIFDYGESTSSNARGLFLPGYRFLFHRSYIKDKQKT